MAKFPEKIQNESELEELLSRPSPEVIRMMHSVEGDMMFLGVAGKIGPSLARMAKRACDMAGIQKRIIGVSRFSDSAEKVKLETYGIETIQGDLLDCRFLESLPQVKNLFFLAGMKFGSEANKPLTWAMNVYLPGLVADHFRESRIVAYSTGCVYPLVPAESGGSSENDDPEPVGEYAQSCLGRERMFGYGSSKHETQVAIIRLNYAVEPRYGVLVDIARKVKAGQAVDVTMGYFNAIWQGDANDMVLRSLRIACSPPRIINITGSGILQVREVALKFGKLFGKKVGFTGREAPTSLLSNANLAINLMGSPQTSVDKVIEWTAGWMEEENKLLDKPTHFEVRDGRY